METQVGGQSRVTGGINVFGYDNYREYLRDLYEESKKRSPGFSYRYFSVKAGFRSPNFLKLVIEGKRNLSEVSIERFVRALRLKKKEALFFRILVHLNQAKTVDEKKFFAEQLIRFRPFRSMYPIKKEQYAYYSEWYNVAIRELAGLPGFREDPEWIARNLIPPISPRQAGKAVELLLGLGLLRRDQSGRLVQTDAVVTTGDQVTSASVMDFHREMIRKGAEAVERTPASDRDISSVTLTLSEGSFREIISLIQQLRKQLLTIGKQEESPGAVYQINFQLFPLTKVLKKEAGE